MSETKPTQEGTKMRQGRGKLGMGLALALWGGWFSGSCVEVGGSLAIVQAQVTDTADNACVIPSERTGTRLSSGILDVALDRGYPYKLYPLVANRLPTLADSDGVEPNRIEVTATEVTIESPPGVTIPWAPSCPPHFDYASDRVGLGPGEEASILVEAFRACHADLLRQLFASKQLPSGINDEVRFRAIIKVKGRHGGTHIASDRFEFPIRVCFGCLQTGYTEADFVQYSFPNIPPCSSLSANPYPGNACNPGQDVRPILCCTRDPAGKDVECPGIPRPQL